MRYANLSVASSLVGMLLACGGQTDGPAANSDPSPAGEPVSGFYALTIATTADSCTPARLAGDQGTVLLVASGQAVNIPLLFTEPGPRQDLPWSGSRQVDFAGCAGSTLGITVLDKSNRSLTVEVAERWQGLASCSTHANAPLLGVPSGECGATRRFEMTLVAACPATVGGVSCR